MKKRILSLLAGLLTLIALGSQLQPAGQFFINLTFLKH